MASLNENMKKAEQKALKKAQNWVLGTLDNYAGTKVKGKIDVRPSGDGTTYLATGTVKVGVTKRADVDVVVNVKVFDMFDDGLTITATWEGELRVKGVVHKVRKGYVAQDAPVFRQIVLDAVK